jgi:enolase
MGFQEAMQWYKDSALIVGDDFTATNPMLIQKYGEQGLANAVIIKPNQIGTMAEVYDAIRTARRYGWKIIVSHRSGETLDSFIADLAVGVGAYGIKAGAYTQPERAAKYERLVEIEKEMAGTTK